MDKENGTEILGCRFPAGPSSGMVSDGNATGFKTPQNSPLTHTRTHITTHNILDVDTQDHEILPKHDLYRFYFLTLAVYRITLSE